MILASNAGRDVVVPREPEDIALKTPIRNPMTSLPEADVVELRDILVELDSQDSDESASRIRWSTCRDYGIAWSVCVGKGVAVWQPLVVANGRFPVLV